MKSSKNPLAPIETTRLPPPRAAGNWSRDAIEELLVELRAFAKTTPDSDDFYFHSGKLLGTAMKHRLL